jgi:hypothetical protein
MQQRKELDAKKRSDIVKEVQRLTAVDMIDRPKVGHAPMLTLRWPWFGNHGVMNSGGYTARPETTYWFDQ